MWKSKRKRIAELEREVAAQWRMIMVLRSNALVHMQQSRKLADAVIELSGATDVVINAANLDEARISMLEKVVGDVDLG